MNLDSPTFNQFKRHLLQSSNQKSQTNNGFSLVELIIIVAIVGILTAIAAPAWDALVTRQRIRTVNNQVLQALQTARAEAKRNKQDVTVAFEEDPPKYKIGDQPDQLLNLEGEVPDGQIQIETPASNGTPANEVTFNYLGSVINKDNPKLPPNLPFAVIVSPGGSTSDASQRCVIVQTLLGAMRTAEGSDCS